MKRFVIERTEGFRVLEGTGRSQVATMVLPIGEQTGGPENRHPESDQWLYVVAGTGAAIIERETCVLRPGVLVLIEAGEAHEIVQRGDEPLFTLNIYAPPAYPPRTGTQPPGGDARPR